MKRVIITIFLLALAAGTLTSCGGGSSSSSSNQTSRIKTRAFVSNSFSGVLSVIDYSKDLESLTTISVGTSPEFMTLSADRKLTLVFDAGSNAVTVVNNSTEAATANIGLPNWTESIAISPDAKTAWAAVRNAPVSNAPTGTIEAIDITNSALSTTPLAVPLARHIFLNHAGTAMIALSDATTPVATPLSIVDVTTPLAPKVTKSLAAATNLDRPTWAVFSSDDSKAFIVNCGPECGGTTASVSVLDMASGAITNTYAGDGVAGHPFAGSIAMLDSANNLYVAGSPTGYTAGNPAVPAGVLWVLSTNSGSLSLNKGPINIGDGIHTTMQLASSNKLFIGANPCSNVPASSASAPPQGCLTIYDTAAGTAVVQPANGFVTGMSPIPGRNVVYVVEGGELKIFDTTTSAEFKERFIDVVGHAFDVKAID